MISLGFFFHLKGKVYISQISFFFKSVTGNVFTLLLLPNHRVQSECFLCLFLSKAVTNYIELKNNIFFCPAQKVPFYLKKFFFTDLFSLSK